MKSTLKSGASAVARNIQQLIEAKRQEAGALREKAVALDEEIQRLLTSLEVIGEISGKPHVPAISDQADDRSPKNKQALSVEADTPIHGNRRSGFRSKLVDNIILGFKKPFTVADVVEAVKRTPNAPEMDRVYLSVRTWRLSQRGIINVSKKSKKGSPQLYENR